MGLDNDGGRRRHAFPRGVARAAGIAGREGKVQVPKRVFSQGHDGRTSPVAPDRLPERSPGLAGTHGRASASEEAGEPRVNQGSVERLPGGRANARYPAY
jgi:hypothetical protein